MYRQRRPAQYSAGTADLYMVARASVAYSARLHLRKETRCAESPISPTPRSWLAATPPCRGASARPTRSSSRAAATRSCGTSKDKRYIDFAGGIAVLNTGHCHPEVIAAVKAQLELYTHTCFQVIAYEPYVELAERLNCARAGQLRQEDAAPVDRRRSGRERGQDRARPHQAQRHHRLHRRLPRPHADDPGTDRQGRALQGGIRAVSRARSSTPRSRTRCTASASTTRWLRSRRS